MGTKQGQPTDQEVAREIVARMGYATLQPLELRLRVERRAMTCVRVLRHFVESERRARRR